MYNSVFNLTQQEKKIIKLMSEGLNNEQICQKLFIAKSTLKNHITKIYQKLDLSNNPIARTIAVIKYFKGEIAQ